MQKCGINMHFTTLLCGHIFEHANKLQNVAILQWKCVTRARLILITYSSQLITRAKYPLSGLIYGSVYSARLPRLRSLFFPKATGPRSVLYTRVNGLGIIELSTY